MITEGATCSVTNHNITMSWNVIPDHVVLHHQKIPSRRPESLGIRDLAFRERIKEEELCLAELFLHLNFKNGEWVRYLDILNRKVGELNEQTLRRQNRDDSHLLYKKNKDRIPPFTKSEFLVGLAIIIGSTDCSKKGEILWASMSEKNGKRNGLVWQWKHILGDI